MLYVFLYLPIPLALLALQFPSCPFFRERVLFASIFLSCTSLCLGILCLFPVFTFLLFYFFERRICPFCPEQERNVKRLLRPFGGFGVELYELATPSATPGVSDCELALSHERVRVSAFVDSQD